MPTPITNPTDNVRLVAQAFRLANDAAVSDLESEAHPVTKDGQRWWDTRPMLDANRHTPRVLAMLAEALTFGLLSELFEPHPSESHLVRVAHPERS